MPTHSHEWAVTQIRYDEPRGLEFTMVQVALKCIGCDCKKIKHVGVKSKEYQRLRRLFIDNATTKAS